MFKIMKTKHISKILNELGLLIALSSKPTSEIDAMILLSLYEIRKTLVHYEKHLLTPRSDNQDSGDSCESL